MAKIKTDFSVDKEHYRRNNNNTDVILSVIHKHKVR